MDYRRSIGRGLQPRLDRAFTQRVNQQYPQPPGRAPTELGNYLEEATVVSAMIPYAGYQKYDQTTLFCFYGPNRPALYSQYQVPEDRYVLRNDNIEKHFKIGKEEKLA